MAFYENIIIAVVLLLFLLILLAVVYIVCHRTKQKGVYDTEEVKDMMLTDRSDMAFMYSPDGVPIQHRKEWFV